MVRRYDDAIDVRMNDVRSQCGQVQDVHDGPCPHDGQVSAEGGLVLSRPEAFVWRDRLYLVRVVQARWYERRSWWREAAAAALLGLRGDDVSVFAPAPATDSQPVPAPVAARARGVGPSGHVRQTSRPVEARGPSQHDVVDQVDGETEVWRVEAAAGRSFPVGVFDLARSVAPGSVAPGSVAPGGWRLIRIAD